MIHTNTNQQYAMAPFHPTTNQVAASLCSSTNNPIELSTPISASSKRGRKDVSGISETNVQLRSQLPQTSGTLFPNNTNNERLRIANQQTNDDIYSVQQCQNQPPHLTQNSNEDNQQPTITACRYAASRYPFSPFSVVFTQEVREKLIIDDLIEYAMDK